jgi:hypothetical protein
VEARKRAKEGVVMTRLYLVIAVLLSAGCSQKIALDDLPCPPAQVLYAWIYDQPVLPDGAKGFSCNGIVVSSPSPASVTVPGFAFAASVDPAANPDAVCWQSAPIYDCWFSHGFLYRQQFRRLHIKDPGVCTANGVPSGKCSIEGIRVCRADAAAGKETPCLYKGNSKTGPNGCAPCDLAFVPE